MTLGKQCMAVQDAADIAPPDPDPARCGEAIRVRRASDLSVPDADLLALADDVSITVRAALALNAAIPAPVVQALQHDADDRVRALLARRIASLLPRLTASHRGRLQEQMLQSLYSLAKDETVRVRAALADIVKDMPEAPHDLVLQLAGDPHMSVAGPVLELSPQLTDDDLLGLLAAPPSPATAAALARRPALSERVTQAIAIGCDVAAIEIMLHNASCMISESVLDGLAARSAVHVGWQSPLVRRPKLSASTARLLADIVAAHLLEELAQRTDLPIGLTTAISRQLLQQLLRAAPAPPDLPASLDGARRVARTVAQARLLTEAAVIAAAHRGDAALCIAMLAVAADVDIRLVERACQLRSAKGLVSLIWCAGFSMHAAGPLQSLLLRCPPDAGLRSAVANSFPLTQTEMTWQIGFLKQSSAAAP